MDKLERDDLEAAALEAGDDLADEGALDAIGLDHDVGTLGVAWHSTEKINQRSSSDTRRDVTRHELGQDSLGWWGS